MRPSWKWAVPLVLPVLAVPVLAVWSMELDQTPWMASPDQVNVCGRRYYLGHLDPVRRDVALRDAPVVVGRVRTWTGSKSVWGVPNDGSTCGLGVFVETSHDIFRGYQLSGGP